jgi:hypothetical protein
MFHNQPEALARQRAYLTDFGEEETRLNEGSVLAFDLGATSGRAILGSLVSRQVELQEIHRFPNEPAGYNGELHWDAPRLWHEILVGLRLAGSVGDGALEAWESIAEALISRCEARRALYWIIIRSTIATEERRVLRCHRDYNRQLH